MKKLGLSGNLLKIFACAVMLVDHMGLILFDNNIVCRIIGRLAFPIFAFFIAEGCFYTKNKLRYFLQIFILGVLCQLVYVIACGDWFFNILLTFSFSIALIFSIDLARRKEGFWWLIPAAILGVSVFLSIFLPEIVKGSGFEFDYGFVGMIIPVLVYMVHGKWPKLLAMAVGLILLSIVTPWQIAWYSLLALIPLALYNGERGRLKMKYFFYIFYPLHLAVLYGISMLL